MDGCLYGCLHGYMYGWMDRWMTRTTNKAAAATTTTTTKKQRTIQNFDRGSDSFGCLFDHVAFGFVQWHGQEFHGQSKITTEFLFHNVHQLAFEELFVSFGKHVTIRSVLGRQRINDLLGVGTPTLGGIVNDLVCVFGVRGTEKKENKRERKDNNKSIQIRRPLLFLQNITTTRWRT